MALQEDITEKQKEEYKDAGFLNKVALALGKDFNVSIHQYPEDLGGQDTLHYIEFSINVRGKSKYNQDNRQFAVQPIPGEAGLSEDDLSQAATLGATAVSAGIGSKISKSIFKAIPGTGGDTEGFVTRLLGAAGGVVSGVLGLGQIALSDIFSKDTTYRISDVIALYLDKPPTVKYSMDYKDTELGTLAGILGDFNILPEEGGMMDALLMKAASVPAIFGAVNVQDVISASAGVSLNPFKEAIFRAVNFRTFEFNYKFFPKSRNESDRIKDIIDLFKFHMHPELSESQLFFIYPAEFEITYFYGAARNPYFHKIAPCILKDMEVTYGGEQFAAFPDGHPAEINMTLRFQESEILTKPSIEAGY